MNDMPFIKCIIEEPDEDIHRLAYADWLIEKDTELSVVRGKFIHDSIMGNKVNWEEVAPYVFAYDNVDWLGCVRPKYVRGMIEHCAVDVDDINRVPLMRVYIPLRSLTVSCNRAFYNHDAREVVMLCRGLKEIRFATMTVHSIDPINILVSHFPRVRPWRGCGFIFSR